MNSKFAQLSISEISPSDGGTGPRGIAPSDGGAGPRGIAPSDGGAGPR
jgi:hypothetical protein